MFKFHLNLKCGFVKPSGIIPGNNPDKNCSKKVQENVHVALCKYWSDVKFKPILLGAPRYLFWPFGINAILICIGYIYMLYILYMSNNSDFYVRGSGIFQLAPTINFRRK